jgi:general stress protein YciG
MASPKKEIKTLADFSSAGGKATAKRRGKKYMQELGRKGGKANVKKHGKKHMSKLGKLSQKKAREEKAD